jgi:hypothetical protein
MNFSLHKEVRWSDDVSPLRYTNAVKHYYRHLSRLRLSRAKTLLKYFGDSFFHDAEVVSIEIRLIAEMSY